MAEYDAAHASRLPKPPGSAYTDEDSPPPGPLPKPPGHAERPTNPHPNHHHPITIFPEPIKPAEKKKKKKTPAPKGSSSSTGDDRRRRRSCCCLCCIWSVVALFVILVLLSLFSALTYAWLHPKLPEFRVEKLGATRLNVSEKAGHALLDAGFDVVIAVWNRNDAVRLEHGVMKVGLFAGDDVRLGKGSAPGFRQEENNMTVVAVETRVTRMAVDSAAGKALERRYKSKTLEVDVVVETEERAVVGNWRSAWMPVKVVCANVKPSRNENGTGSRCGIRYHRAEKKVLASGPEGEEQNVLFSSTDCSGVNQRSNLHVSYKMETFFVF
ncbi:NDR1/HIN1-like protein 6 [Cocos nucifera]|uniref:NDR1/HIN1-like protein 6 n=1 Tax=Cocos nucifera TaxID=13894 RepID=A0A8K0NA41_COCNU|nr:NDR1/HIN1-like protein 6 [Cocos nucifera]